MNIRNKLYLILALFLLQPVALLTGAYFHGVSDQHLMRQIHLAHTELEARYELLANVSRQMDEATDVLLTGDVEEVEEFRKFGQSVIRSFEKLERPNAVELGWDESSVPRPTETTKLRKLYIELSKEIDSALQLASAGRREDAIEWVEEIVEEQYDTRFLPMLDRQVRDWRAVVARTAEAAATETAVIGNFAIGLSSLLAMVFAAVAMLISFSLIKGISSQLQTISQAARSIGAGRLDTRIDIHNENELGQLGETLNTMAEELDGHISKLAEARRSAEAASEAKSHFLANITHEIRTPMNGILGMAQLLEEANLDEEQREYAQIIQGSAQALLTIINDLLDFSKIEAGELKISSEPFDLAALVEDVTALLAPIARDKNLRIYNDFEVPFPAWFKGDSGRIRQCLINLVGNAVKFTVSGHVHVVVRGDSSGNICIDVKDTGPGIPDGKRDQIFLPFEQADSGTSRSAEGTGLGLAITRQLAELMGGNLHLLDEVGYGSVFSLHLPLSPALVPSENTGPDYSRLRGTTVVVMDSNQEDRVSLVKCLSAWGVQAIEAVTLQETLYNLIDAPQKSTSPCALVLDAAMPGMGALDLLRAAQLEPSTTVPSVILLSEEPISISANDRRNFDIVAVLPKPVRCGQLANVLVQVTEAKMRSDCNRFLGPVASVSKQA